MSLPCPEFWRRLFGSEESCRQILARGDVPAFMRFRKCPNCGASNHDGGGPTAVNVPAQSLWRCQTCNTQMSLLNGTYLAKTSIPLTAWFDVLYTFAERRTDNQRLTASEVQRRYPLLMGDPKTAQRMVRLVKEKLFVADEWRGFSFRISERTVFYFQNGGLYCRLLEGRNHELAHDDNGWKGWDRYFKALSDAKRRLSAARRPAWPG